MYYKRNYGFTPRTFGGLIEDLQNGWNKVAEEVSSFSTPVNIQETETAYELHVVAPGLKKEDFKVSVDKDILNISYDHKQDAEKTEAAKWLRNEYATRSFKRSFTLNDKIDASKINAKYNDGVLLVTLAKKENVEQPKHEIAVD